MTSFVRFDWPEYFRGLPECEARTLAHWLAAQELGVGEFMDIVDRTHAAAPAPLRAPSRSFLAQWGRPAAAAYARRKRQFAELSAVLEQALAAGALPGEVRPDELQLPISRVARQRCPDDLFAALERARRAASRW